MMEATSGMFLMNFLYLCSMLIFIVSQQMRYLKKADMHTYTYYCPCNYTLGCAVKIRLEFSENKCAIYGTMQSHKEKIWKHTGRDDLMQQKQPPKRCSRKSGGKRNLFEELGGSSEDGIGGAKAFSCEDGFGAAKAGGTIRRKKAVGNTQSKSFFHDFAVQKCIYKLLSNHETCGINLDQVVCLGHQFDDGVFYLGLLTCSMVCNVFRAIASG